MWQSLRELCSFSFQRRIWCEARKIMPETESWIPPQPWIALSSFPLPAPPRQCYSKPKFSLIWTPEAKNKSTSISVRLIYLRQSVLVVNIEHVFRGCRSRACTCSSRSGTPPPPCCNRWAHFTKSQNLMDLADMCVRVKKWPKAENFSVLLIIDLMPLGRNIYRSGFAILD